MPKSTEPSPRTILVREMMTHYFSEALKSSPKLSKAIEGDLDIVFKASQRGFREIVLVVTLARLMDKQYKATDKLYACHPRPLYEKGIRGELASHGVPHGKSGPLNIAKATVALNADWAGQRKPRNVADSVVRLATQIDAMSGANLKSFAVVLHKKFLELATRAAGMAVDFPNEADPCFLRDICVSAIKAVPDAGNTPQRIVGLLLKALHAQYHDGIKVAGAEDRASVTSTTSGKLGDISEEGADGEVLSIYEVTAKPFGPERVEESDDALSKHVEAMRPQCVEVLVLCRPEDCHPGLDRKGSAGSFMGSHHSASVAYRFINIFEWIGDTILRLTPRARAEFLQALQGYVNHPDTNEKVKRHFGALVKGMDRQPTLDL